MGDEGVISIDLDYTDPHLNGGVTYTVVARDPATGRVHHQQRLDLLDEEAREQFAQAVALATGYDELSDEVAARMAEKLEADGAKPKPKSVRELLDLYPNLRIPVIDGLLRQGETMNVIAPPKTGKSWLVVDLAIAVATGRCWLDTYATHAGDVLIIDNELHGETIAHRIPKVAQGRGVMLSEFIDHIFVESLRGKLKDLLGLRAFFSGLEPGRFKVIILDAFYRFMPQDSDENDNATMAQLYNVLDQFADRLGCCFVLIHHSTKGVQGHKAVTDVGAGAGSQSRATDTHLVLRAHEEEGVVVLDAAVRSWSPINPVCLRWAFPVWQPAHELDPTQLRKEGRRRQSREPAEPKEPKVVWTVDRFVSEFVGDEPQAKAAIVVAAEGAGLSERKAGRFLDAATAAGKIHKWGYKADRTPYYATGQQPLTAARLEGK